MVGIEISEKEYNGIYRCYKGKEVKTDIALYNSALISTVEQMSDIKFIVYSNDNDLQKDKEYWIVGVGNKNSFWGLRGNTNFVYLVEIIDDEIYYQNSGSGNIKGKVFKKRKFKMNFDINDVAKKKNTFFNFVEEVGYTVDNTYLEQYALGCLNFKLLENIFRYKNTYYDDYTEEQFQCFKQIVIKKVTIRNPNKEQILKELREIDTFKNLAYYIKRNKEKLLDNRDLLYNRNDNIQNKYPINMVGTNIKMNLYDGYKFNSALPFYFQYRNYRQSTEILLKIFIEEIGTMENKRIENSLKVGHWIYGKEKPTKDNKPELAQTNTISYGLYFPLFMNFRHSVELALKLIFVNEDLKKQKFSSKKELSEYADVIKTHQLPRLLFLIKQYLETDVYEFLLNLSSFIYYNEGTDDSFSRYLVDKELEFDKLKPVTLYYVDLKNYIDEFYQIMDEVFKNMNFGFDINKVFV
ncbi:hypothetical protein G4948_03490 [Blautia caecimuris]|nr:hypothetical protein [Blautia caecimuris]NSG66858.1 hypothetical protein [Blautia caecimuris]